MIISLNVLIALMHELFQDKIVVLFTTIVVVVVVFINYYEVYYETNRIFLFRDINSYRVRCACF